MLQLKILFPQIVCIQLHRPGRYPLQWVVLKRAAVVPPASRHPRLTQAALSSPMRLPFGAVTCAPGDHILAKQHRLTSQCVQLHRAVAYGGADLRMFGMIDDPGGHGDPPFGSGAAAFPGAVGQRVGFLYQIVHQRLVIAGGYSPCRPARLSTHPA